MEFADMAGRRHNPERPTRVSHDVEAPERRDDPPRVRRVATTAAVAAAIVGLLTVVAVSTVAREPIVGRSSADRDLSPALLDYVLSTFLALYLALIPVALWATWKRGGWRRDPNAGRRRDVAMLVFVGVILVALLGLRGVGRLEGNPEPTQPEQLESAPTDGQPESAGRRRGELRLAPFVVIGLGLGAAMVYLSYRRRQLRRPLREGDEDALAAELGLLLDDAIDDLLAEPDPRRAVIAAYARMERALAAFGLPRDDAEAPLEYLERIGPEIAHIPGAPGLAFELTHLYERARFSAHRVDVEMKDDAISALVRLRAELQEWAA
jgi:hypothetical protein